jgi:eukaryotic-like serine/threonine-protein kinase
MKTTIGRYRIERKLGEGGMGVVYAAHDDQLGREVAIKTIREASGVTARQRLWREARAAAAIPHPNVCHVYEVGEDGDTIYIVMELLAGEPLSERIERSAVPVGEAASIALSILAALEALHGRGIVHRDLKPGNVFLTPHGTKLLDFGLAQSGDLTSVDVKITATGMVAGTPRYMSPEQLEGKTATPASDQFAFGCILFEMLAGRPAFAGTSLWDISHAVLHESPPALTGGPRASALDRVIARCLAKRPEDRYPDVATIGREIRAAAALSDTGDQAVVRPTTRLIVVPFRLLRPDPDLDFLSFSLADSLVVSLAGFGPLVVRSSHLAQQFAGETLDLKRIGSEAQVDLVLTGSILRAGERVRVIAQLVEVPGGAVAWSKTAQVEMGDIFQVQDDLARQVLDSLSVPLTARERAQLARSVPKDGEAYELYLRANHLAHGTINEARLRAARELYLAAVQRDPNYAPAWARLGRVYRVLAKFGSEDDQTFRLAEDAFQRAFALNAELPLAHHLYTHFEIDQLGRAEAAMHRLLQQVRVTPNDPDLFAGLVAACRYCGLLDTSLAADARARQLDPSVRTSVHFTYFLLNDHENVVRYEAEETYLGSISLLQQGRIDEGRLMLRGSETGAPYFHAFFYDAANAAIDRRTQVILERLAKIRAMGFRDPEGLFLGVLLLAHGGAPDEALQELERVVDGGFMVPQMRQQPWIRSLHGDERFERLMARADAGRRQAAERFAAAGGDRLLGVRAVTP